MRVSFPPMSEDQSHWGLYVGGGNRTVYTPRKWHVRAIYRVLMLVHDQAESLWHWSWRVSRQFAAHETTEYVEPALYGYAGSDGVIRPGPPKEANR